MSCEVVFISFHKYKKSILIYKKVFGLYKKYFEYSIKKPD